MVLHAVVSTGSPIALPRSPPRRANSAHPENGQRLAGYVGYCLPKMDRHYALTEDLSSDCLWEGLMCSQHLSGGCHSGLGFRHAELRPSNPLVALSTTWNPFVARGFVVGYLGQLLDRQKPARLGNEAIVLRWRPSLACLNHKVLGAPELPPPFQHFNVSSCRTSGLPLQFEDVM